MKAAQKYREHQAQEEKQNMSESSEQVESRTKQENDKNKGRTNKLNLPVFEPTCTSWSRYCKSTKFRVRFNFANFAFLPNSQN